MIQTRNIVSSGMNQTSFMFGAVLVAFLVFVTMRGDLTKWRAIVGV